MAYRTVNPYNNEVVATFEDLTDAEAMNLLDQAQKTFESWSQASYAERAAVPTVVALREHFEAVRRQILAGASGADADAATRALINRLLHTPSEVLREAAGEGVAGRVALERLARRLFGLTDDEGNER